MSRLIVIMAHGKAQDTFRRHLPHWVESGDDLLVFSPRSDPVDTPIPQLVTGFASHHGPGSIARFRTMLSWLSKTVFDEFIVHEYDSITFGGRATITPGVLRSNEFANSDPSFSGTRFFHPPLAFDQMTLHLLLQASQTVGDSAEKSYWDRWLGLVADQGSVRSRSWGHLGFSRNTIERKDFYEAVRAKKEGAIHFHGIKDATVLYALASQCEESRLAA